MQQATVERNSPAQYQLVTRADLEQFRNELLKEIRYLLSQKPNGLQKPWLRSHEVRRMLQISPGTLQHLRDTGQIPFTKLGGIIYYEHAAIKAKMEKL
ncbi:hypothetical protein BUE76_07775 [Cnuella takakiae]|nr:hypothetical protein BUE76_07775 [Cnuella takakiae]